jgi:DNA modification methylase
MSLSWWNARILQGDCRGTLRTLADASVHCCVTSPPYFGLRDYGHADQIGLEATPLHFVRNMVDVFREVHRVMRPDGTLWLNLGDSYANDGKWGGSTGGKHVKEQHGDTGIGRGKKSTGLKPKELIGIPWRVAFALQEDGWYLRQDIIWAKPNPMPESVRDRCTKAHEYLFLLSKSPSYYFDREAIQEPAVSTNRRPVAGSPVPGKPPQSRRRESLPPRHGQYETCSQEGLSAAGRDGVRNRRSVWTVATRPYRGAHFATFPPALIEPCILAGSPVGGTVLDCFNGSGTTGQVALTHGRHYVGCETNPDYIDLSWKRFTA